MVFMNARVVDSTHLELSEPLKVKEGQRLVIAVAEFGEDLEREVWLHASAANLSAAYDESEPEYPLHLVKEPNPEYKG